MPNTPPMPFNSRSEPAPTPLAGTLPLLRSSGLGASTLRLVQWLLRLLAAALVCLHAIHLTADFPNNSPWKDWSKYTDEGWYGDAAIRHFQLGHWYVQGDFNPAAALPVWPLLEAAVFHFTGVSLTAVRALTVAVFGGICLASWFLLDRWRPSGPVGAHSTAAAAAVLLLAASPFVFVFTRMAILEPLLILLTLLALLAASAARLPGSVPRVHVNRLRHHGRAVQAMLQVNPVPFLALGVLLPVIILTKTTGLFLFPAIAFLLFARLDYRAGPFLRLAVPAATVGFILWLCYYLSLVHKHLLLDYRYLFSANGYTGIDRTNVFSVLSDTVTDGLWMGRLLYPAALAALVCVLLVGVFRFRLLRAHPLLPALLLWIGGYSFFLAYHDNLQPRYYLVIAVPLTLLLPATIEQLLLPAARSPRVRLVLIVASAVLLPAIALPDALKTLAYLRRPQYTLLEAAHAVDRYITSDRRTDPTHNPLILSISGSDISLMTGLPSICDDFGTLELTDRVKQYRPGWYAAWNDVEDDKMEAMAPLFRLQRAAEFPAMDDPERNLLILYKLVPATEPVAPKAKPRPTPHSPRTRVGQQPSVQQLEH